MKEEEQDVLDDIALQEFFEQERIKDFIGVDCKR